MRGSKLAILIPTYNEASNITELVSRLQRVSSQHNLTMVLVILDDNSPDGTGTIVKSLQKEHSNIRLLTGEKAGLGATYLRGLRYILKNIEFDICILMDADLSHDPEDIPKLLNAIKQGADYVIGGRYLVTSKIDADWPLSRIWMSHLANFTARKLVGIDASITDLTGGFKAIRKSALKEIDLHEVNATGFVFQVSLLHTFLKAGFTIKEVPISFKKRLHGKSKLKIKDITEFAYQTYKLNPNAPIQRFVRFATVGLIGTIVNIAILSLLYKGLKLDPLLSSAVAIEVSIINNFFLNHYYTFRGYGAYHIRQLNNQKKLLSKLLKFNIATLGGAAINFGVFSILFKFWHIDYLIADILAIIIALSWNYYASIHFIWNSMD